MIKNRLSYYQQIQNAMEVMNLHSRITFAEIKDIYKKLMKQYHPDTCKEPIEICEQKSKEIANAYKILQKYCQNYRYSFTEEEVANQSHNNWWQERFGSDKTWGN